jgi:indolepyruvate ferredoxin oxidoreductase beta subunit
MKYDVILAGVGGQGVLSVSAIIAASALKEGLLVKQSEVHGMAQRGGAVLTNLRISDVPIHSDIIAHGAADLILSMEPVESLRYVDYLGPEGTIITSTAPVRNIPDYPELEGLLDEIRALPRTILIDAERIAREVAGPLATNVVMVGAASRLLPLRPETIKAQIGEMFARKGAEIVAQNARAFEAGRKAADS